MRKRRSDSPWGQLTRQQTRQMDMWRFEDNLSYTEIVKRAWNEFGVKASEQTLTGYFRHRRELLDWDENIPGANFSEKVAMRDRAGMGKNLDELEARTLFLSAMAAYEMALASPEKMQVKEVRSLMKMLQDSRRFREDRKFKAKRLEMQEVATLAKVVKDQQGKQTREEFEEMVMEGTEIMNKAQRLAAENRARLKAEKAQREGVPNEPIGSDNADSALKSKDDKANDENIKDMEGWPQA